ELEEPRKCHQHGQRHRELLEERDAAGRGNVEPALALHRRIERGRRVLADYLGHLAVTACIVVVAFGAIAATTSTTASAAAPPFRQNRLTVHVNGKLVRNVASNLPNTSDVPTGTLYDECCKGITRQTQFGPNWSIKTLLGAVHLDPSITG